MLRAVTDYDVIVVGAGNAALAAAVSFSTVKVGDTREARGCGTFSDVVPDGRALGRRDP